VLNANNYQKDLIV